MSAKIYEPKGKAREYSPYALNYYKGCSHNCLYCYVPAMFKRFDKNYNHEVVSLRKEIPDILKSIELSAKKHKGGQVLLNFTSDPYNSYENDINLTKEVLKILLKYSIPTAILSKSDLVLRDIELFKKFKGNIVIGQSLTFLNDDDSLEWESGASMPHERINALKVLKQNNIKTWASFEPVINTEQSLNLLEIVTSNNYVDYVKIGKINNYKGIDKNINWAEFLNKAVNICRKNKTDFYIKKDLLKFKEKTLYLSNNEISQDFLSLKGTLTNQLF